jgi:hypothetical protein
VLRAVPTRQVLAGFEPVTADNRRVIVAEAFTMWGIAAVVIAATAAGGTAADARAWVYRAASGLLVAPAVLTALTGARTPVMWFKICPVLLSASCCWPRLGVVITSWLGHSSGYHQLVGTFIWCGGPPRQGRARPTLHKQPGCDYFSDRLGTGILSRSAASAISPPNAAAASANSGAVLS